MVFSIILLVQSNGLIAGEGRDDAFRELMRKMASSSDSLRTSSKSLIDNLDEKIPSLQKGASEMEKSDGKCDKQVSNRILYSIVIEFKTIKESMNSVYADAASVYNESTSVGAMSGVFLGYEPSVLESYIQKLQSAEEKYNTLISNYNETQEKLKEQINYYESSYCK